MAPAEIESLPVRERPPQQQPERNSAAAEDASPQPTMPSPPLSDHLAASTRAIHADDYLYKAAASSSSSSGLLLDVAPALHVSTTFHFPEKPEELIPFDVRICVLG
jgi:hypothetical protein